MPDQSQINTSRSSGRTYPPGYGPVEPVANYRPWDSDAAFQQLYTRIREHTMVDQYRLWTLWFLGGQLPGGDILEVGSWRGGSGAVLAQASRRGRAVIPGVESSAPQAREIFLADTFAGVVKAGERDTYYKGGEHANTSSRTVAELFAQLELGDVTLLEGIFPDETGDRIEQRRFALCHIDVDVYQSAKDVFTWVWPRMVPGGVIVFDDYGFYGCEGVTAFVHEIAGTQLVVPSLSGQAVITCPAVAPDHSLQ